MAGSSINVGTLRAILTADTAQWTAGFRTAASEQDKFAKKVKATNDSMVAANKAASDKMIAAMSAAGKANSASARMIAGMSEAGRQAAAAQAAAAQAALGYSGRLKGLATEALGAAKNSELLGGTVGKLTAAFAGAAVIGTVVGWIRDIGIHALESAGRLSDLSAKTGLSTKTLQEMDFVAEQTGGSLESFTKSVIQLQVRVESGSKPVKKAIADIGLEFDKLRAMKPEEQWNTVVDALEKQENQQKRSTATVALFGKTGADILPAIAEGYRNIAKDASIAGDAQIKALDAVGDAWARLKKNFGTQSTQALGTAALALEGFADASWGERVKGLLLGGTTAFDIFAKRGLAAAESARVLREEQQKAASAANAGAKATESYSAQLAKVRAELAALTPAQRKEIEAAQALGVSNEDLENKYGLTEGALRVLTTTTEANEQATKKNAKTAKEAAEEYKAWQKGIADVEHDMHKLAVTLSNEMNEKAAKQAERTADAQLSSFNRRNDAERGAADTAKDIELARAEFAIEQAKRRGANWKQIAAMEKEVDDARLQRAIENAEREFEERSRWIDRTTAFGRAEYDALQKDHDLKVQAMVESHQQAEELKRQELARTHNVWLQTLDRIKGVADTVAESVASNFTDMLTGAKSFKDGFVGIWHSIRDSILDIFRDILQSFIKGLLGGMMKALLGQRGGFSSAFGGLIGGGGGPGGLFGQGGGIAMSLLGGGGAASLTAPAVSSAAGAAGLASIEGTGLAGGASASGGGAGGAITGLLTNPITIAAGAAALLGWGILKKGWFRGGEEALKVSPRRDQFFGQFGDVQNRGVGGAAHNLAALMTSKGAGDGGGPLFASLQKADTVKEWESAQAAVVSFLAKTGTKVQSFMAGGPVLGPMGVAMPAIVHGGEGILTMRGLRNAGGPEGLKALNAGTGGPSPTIVNVSLNVQAWDHIDAARWLRTQGIAELKRAIVLNTGGFGSVVAEAT